MKRHKKRQPKVLRLPRLGKTGRRWFALSLRHELASAAWGEPQGLSARHLSEALEAWAPGARASFTPELLDTITEWFTDQAADFVVFDPEIFFTPTPKGRALGRYGIRWRAIADVIGSAKHDAADADDTIDADDADDADDSPETVFPGIWLEATQPRRHRRTRRLRGRPSNN